MNSTTLRGVIQGKSIQLETDTGLPDGQFVAISLQLLTPPAQQLTPGEGIRRSAGGWSDDPEGLEEYLDWNRQQRKQARPAIEP